jgi:hypothetical protein
MKGLVSTCFIYQKNCKWLFLLIIVFPSEMVFEFYEKGLMHMIIILNLKLIFHMKWGSFLCAWT